MKKVSLLIIAFLLAYATIIQAQEPVAYVSWKDYRLTDNSGIPRSALLSTTPEVTIGYPTKKDQPLFVVSGFSVVCLKDTVTTEGNHFSKSMIECFKRLKKGATVRLTDIHATDKNGKAVIVEPITLILDGSLPAALNHPVPELVCNGRFYKDNDTILVADIMADTVYLTTRHNGFGEPVKNYQIEKYQVMVSGKMIQCTGPGLSTSIKNLLTEKTSDVRLYVSGINLVEKTKDGTEKSLRIGGCSFNIRVVNNPINN